MFTNSVRCVCVFLAITVASMFVGCSPKHEHRSSKYEIRYEVREQKIYDRILVEIRGEAQKLAVFLTTPNGKTEYQVFEKEQMMTNILVVGFSDNNFQQGNYKILVKSFDSLKILAEKEFQLSLKKVEIKNVEISTRKINIYNRVKGTRLTEIKITTEKDGNLPIQFKEITLSINGMPCELGQMSVENSRCVTAYINRYSASPEMERLSKERESKGIENFADLFQAGDACLVEGVLTYGAGSISFKKEFNITDK